MRVTCKATFSKFNPQTILTPTRVPYVSTGAFGLAILYFVPQDGQLGKNQKRAGHDIFDIYYWMDSWPHFTDLLRNEKPVHFQYDDSDNTAQISSVRAAVPAGSSRFADRFIKAHLLSRQNRKKNI